jgi:hypothetical protein
MQRDGNLVLKRTTVGYPVCWATGTAGQGHHAVYQRNGDFVVVNSAGRGIWRSNTIGETWETGQTVNIAADGDLYVGYKKMDSC